MIDTLIGFLQRLKQGRGSNMVGFFVFIVCLLVGVALIVGAIRGTAMVLDELGWDEGRSWVGLVVSVVCIYIGILVLLATWKVKDTDTSLGKYFYAIIMPLASLALLPILVESNGLYIEFDLIENFVERIGTRVSVVLYLFTAFYSLLSLWQIIHQRLRRSRILHTLKSWFLGYNIGFFFFVAFVMTLAVFQGERTKELNVGFRRALLLFLYYLFVFTYPLITLRLSCKKGGTMRWVWGVVVMGLLFGMSYLPGVLGNLYEWQINRTHNILAEHGENITSYEKAKGIFLLETSFLFIFKNRGMSDNDIILFQKLYDSTPEQYFAEKLFSDNERRTTNATNTTEVGKKANVALKLAEIENTIVQEGDEMPLLETTYRFHFANESDRNQEVVLTFEAPSKYSVVTDLKLGLNLELQGQVASRGAAKKVYEDSLRVNKDPALIEKVGINTYTLRVFPIPSKLDSRTLGIQQVQLTLLSPIEQENLLYAPKFSFINLKVTDDSSLISKVYRGSDLLQEDIVKEKEVEDYLHTSHSLGEKLPISGNKTLNAYCISKEMQTILGADELKELLIHKRGEKSKISLFFDNSLSNENNQVNELYSNVFTIIKNFDGKLRDTDIYSYNFRVEKVASVDDIQYWGYSDIDSVLDYIENNRISNQRIVLLTDDDGFNMTTTENKNRNYTDLMTNQFIVLKIGDQVKTYKSDFTNLVAATQGNIYTLAEGDDLEDILERVFRPDDIQLGLCETEEEVVGDEYTEEDQELTAIRQTLVGKQQGGEAPKNIVQKDFVPSKVEKIMAGYIGNALLGLVENARDWEKVANLQSELASTYTIVNQFNSMIALENEQQQRDLVRYEQESDRYDSEYNNYSKRSPWTNTQQPFMMREDISVGAMPEFASDGARDAGGGGNNEIINLARRSPYYEPPVEKRGYSNRPYGDVNARGITIVFIAIIYLMYIWQLILFFITIVKNEKDEDGRTSMTEANGNGEDAGGTQDTEGIPQYAPLSKK